MLLIDFEIKAYKLFLKISIQNQSNKQKIYEIDLRNIDYVKQFIKFIKLSCINNKV